MEVKGLTKLFTFVVAAASGAAAFLYLAVWMCGAALTFGDTSFVKRHSDFSFSRWDGPGSPDLGPVTRPASTIQPDDLRRPRVWRQGPYGVASVWILHGVEALYLFVYPPFADHGIFACERPVCADFSFHFTSRGFDGRVAAAAGTLRALRGTAKRLGARAQFTGVARSAPRLALV